MNRLIIVLMMLGLVACNPCKRLQRRCPELFTAMQDSTIYESITTYDTITVQVPGDTVRTEISLEDLGLVDTTDADTTTITVETDRQKTTITVRNDTVYIGSVWKPQLLIHMVKNLYERLERYKEIPTPVEVPVQYVPKFYKGTLWFSLAVVVIGLVVLIIKLRSGAVKSILGRL